MVHGLETIHKIEADLKERYDESYCSHGGEQEDRPSGVLARSHEQLLPCPFCGGPAATDQLGEDYSMVYCHEENECVIHPECGYYSTPTEAREWWNRRAGKSHKYRVTDGQ